MAEVFSFLSVGFFNFRLKRLSFLHRIPFACLTNVMWPYLCGSVTTSLSVPLMCVLVPLPVQ